MVKHCCYGTCKSDTRNDASIKFIAFPKAKVDLKRAKRWIHLCGRADFSLDKITPYTYICVNHFPKGVDLNLQTNLDLEPFPAHAEDEHKQRQERNRRHIAAINVDTPEIEICWPNLASSISTSFEQIKIKSNAVLKLDKGTSTVEKEDIDMAPFRKFFHFQPLKQRT
jgi:hypothetical protein